MRLIVRTPATVANLGAGFDCLALALDLANEATVEPAPPRDPGVVVHVEGEGAEELPSGETNLMAQAMSRLASEAGRPLPPVRLRCLNRIPLRRGLGSSAAAVVAGVLLADRLVETDLSADALLELAAAMEGHGDNVAACLRGGLAVVYRTARGWSVETVAPNPGLRPVVLIPESEWVATDVARRALPSTVPLADAAFQVSRASLAVLAMTQRPHLLAAALEDRLHQGYRFPLMPFARAAFDELRRAGLPVCVAGSGPALLAFEQGDHRLPDLGPGWRLLRPRIAETGAAIREG